MNRPPNYSVASDDPTNFDKRGFRTAMWNKRTNRWEMFCPPFEITCTGDLHIVDIVGACDCEMAAFFAMPTVAYCPTCTAYLHEAQVSPIFRTCTFCGDYTRTLDSLDLDD